ncbi:MAG: hypothetical protein QXU64_02015 [Thermofilaceae archaeon]
MAMEPPRLSAITRILAYPEQQFERAVKSLLNIELPPGPQSTLLRLQERFESGAVPELREVLPGARAIEELIAMFPRVPPMPAAERAAAAPAGPGEVRAEKLFEATATF